MIIHGETFIWMIICKTAGDGGIKRIFWKNQRLGRIGSRNFWTKGELHAVSSLFFVITGMKFLLSTITMGV